MITVEQRLVALGSALDVPETPDLAPAVLAYIGERPARRPRRLILAFAVLLLAALLAALAIPDARSALARFLQIGADRIELVERLPAVPTTSPELELALGERVALDEARARASFPLLELDDRPDAVYVGERGTVWFLYGRPEAVRLLVAQTPRVEVDEPFVLKKLVEAGTTVEPATIRGEPGYFLSGEPHVLLLIDESGMTIQESARLARDVLVWEENGRTVRIEGDLTRAEALDLARSLR